MAVRYASGRDRTTGAVHGQTTPIELDPAAYDKHEVQGFDNLRHYSIGSKWVPLAPVLSTLIDGGNAATDHENAARIDLGTAAGNESFPLP